MNEKILNGLKCCVFEESCEESCPYNVGDDDVCITALMRDAYKALKAYEPHILTLDEVVGGEMCWFEGMNSDYYAFVRRSMYDGHVEINTLGRGILVLPMSTYGELWKRWSSKPKGE